MPSARLTAKESLILWGIIIGTAFGFFVFGLWLGLQERGEQPSAELQASSRQPAPQSEKRLDLAHPVEPAAGGMNAKPLEPASSKPTGTVSAEPAATKATRPLTIKLEPPPKTTAAAKPAATPAASPAPIAGPRGMLFTIQLGALKTEAEARRLMAQLKEHGYTGIIDMPTGRDSYYRVRVGGYDTREAAVKAEALLRREGFSTFIKRIDRRSAN